MNHSKCITQSHSMETVPEEGRGGEGERGRRGEGEKGRGGEGERGRRGEGEKGRGGEGEKGKGEGEMWSIELFHDINCP